MGQTLDDMPPDPTNLEDQIHAALFSGHPDQALEHAARLDPWLAAHLGDFMSVLALIETDVERVPILSSVFTPIDFLFQLRKSSRRLHFSICRIPAIRLRSLANYGRVPVLMWRCRQAKGGRGNFARSLAIAQAGRVS